MIVIAGIRVLCKCYIQKQRREEGHKRKWTNNRKLSKEGIYWRHGTWSEGVNGDVLSATAKAERKINLLHKRRLGRKGIDLRHGTWRLVVNGDALVESNPILMKDIKKLQKKE